MDLSRRAAAHAALGDPLRLAVVDSLRHGDLTPGELTRLLRVSSGLLTHHLNTLEGAGIVQRRRSEGDARRRYVVLCTDLLGRLLPRRSFPAAGVLFVCTQNSARSQFAAAYWQVCTGLSAASAGTAPAPAVHPLAIRVAAEYGLDLRSSRPQGLAEVAAEPDLVVSVCDRAGETPLAFQAARLHWSVADPVPDGRRSAFRRAFGEISARIDDLAATTNARATQ